MVRILKLYGSQIMAKHAFESLIVGVEAVKRTSLRIVTIGQTEIWFEAGHAADDLERLRGRHWDAIDVDDTFFRFGREETVAQFRAMIPHLIR